ncbi:unnamed protein product, partial [Symbiodinium sp. KB8]
MGAGVAFTPDVDGDGMPELVFGLPTAGSLPNFGAGVVGILTSSARPVPYIEGAAHALNVSSFHDAGLSSMLMGSAFGSSAAEWQGGHGGSSLLLVGAPLATVSGSVEAGAVLAFQFDSQRDTVFNVKVLSVMDAVLSQHLAAGFRFGAAMATVDLDGDGYDELLASFVSGTGDGDVLSLSITPTCAVVGATALAGSNPGFAAQLDGLPSRTGAFGSSIAVAHGARNDGKVLLLIGEQLRDFSETIPDVGAVWFLTVTSSLNVSSFSILDSTQLGKFGVNVLAAGHMHI